MGQCQMAWIDPTNMEITRCSAETERRREDKFECETCATRVAEYHARIAKAIAEKPSLADCSVNPLPGPDRVLDPDKKRIIEVRDGDGWVRIKSLKQIRPGDHFRAFEDEAMTERVKSPEGSGIWVARGEPYETKGGALGVLADELPL